MENISKAIVSIMRKAGGDVSRCTTCCKPASMPYRRHDRETGKIIEGCIDAVHTEHLEGIASESARWHFRPEGVALRRATLNFLRSL